MSHFPPVTFTRSPRCSGRLTGRTFSLLMLLVALTASSQASAGDLEDVPFWRVSAGFWVSDNTYFNGSLDYNIRAYNSIVQVEINGDTMRETEYKFYPPGKMAKAYGAGKTGEDEGIEVVTVFTGTMLDDSGTVRIDSIRPELGGEAETRIAVLGQDTAVRVTTNPGGQADLYRMFITMPDPDRRYVANFGLVDRKQGSDEQPGDLRGFSLFRGKRIGQADFEAVRERLRQTNRVAAVVTADDEGKPQAVRLR